MTTTPNNLILLAAQQGATIGAITADTKPFVQLETIPSIVHSSGKNCLHATLRAQGNGHCIICDGPLPLIDPHDAAEQLDADEDAASVELAALDADAARLDLVEFVAQAWHVLEPMELEMSWHIIALCKNMQAMLDEWMHRKEDPTYVMRWQNLVINICPSTLKSRIIMVFAVAWMWLRCPTWSVLCVSVNPANVTRDAEACRDLVTSRWYRETFNVAWKIREDIDSKAKFATTAGGMRYSRGLISKFTGIHVDGIFLDDPDDAHDVHSEAARRERAGKWESISSRVNDRRHCIRVISQQRVHVDDCTGDVLSRGGYLQASYPLEYHAAHRVDSPFFTDPRTVEGQILHRIRFTQEVIAAARLELGTAGFEAQYNQNPAPIEGGMIQRLWFRFGRLEGKPIEGFARPQGCHTGEAFVIPVDDQGRAKLDWLAVSCDATFGSLNDSASAVGLQLIGGIGPKRIIFKDRTKPRTFNDTKAAIRQMMTDAKDLLGRTPDRVLIEKKANGAAIVEDLELEFSGVIPLEVDGGKESRAAAMSPAIESHCVLLLDGEQWLEEFIGEVCVFPHGKRDDRVDTLSQTMSYFREGTDAQKLAAKNAAMAAMRNTLYRRITHGN